MHAHHNNLFGAKKKLLEDLIYSARINKVLLLDNRSIDNKIILHKRLIN